MILIVEDRDFVGAAYENSFSREGFAATSVPADEFGDWVNAAAEDDIEAVTAFVFGSCASSQDMANLVRRRSAAAVIALTEARSVDETVELLAAGYDDVVATPCHAKELIARVAAITRRRSSNVGGTSIGEITVFGDGRDPCVRGEVFPLPRRELRILEVLASRAGRRVTKSQIFNSVYGIFDHDIDECVVESHISKLRRRLRGALGYDPIESKRHLGYRLYNADELPWASAADAIAG